MKEWILVITPTGKKCEYCWVKTYCKKDNGAVPLKEKDWLALHRFIKQCKMYEHNGWIGNSKIEKWKERRF